MTKNIKTILVIDDEPQGPVEQSIASALKADLEVKFINIDLSEPGILDANLDIDQEKLNQ